MKKLSLVLAVMLILGVSFAAMDKMTDKKCDVKNYAGHELCYGR